MESHFDAVVIGSGFGGSVIAYRLAEAGRRVCVLERGRAYPPGSFPRSPESLARNIWAPDRGQYGLFDFWQFRGAEAVVSSGVGGGSLIYANVLIRKPEQWFVQEHLDGSYLPWPVTRSELDRHYDVAERMLNGQRFPFQHAPYNKTRKTQALLDAGKQLNLPAELPLLAVTFANKDRPPVPGELIEGGSANLHKAERFTCRLCGECDVGCNYGSKNTLDYNYLSLAVKHGAELRPLCEAKRITPTAAGYTLEYVQHDAETKTNTRVTITAKRVIVAAGTLGSVFFLLRNKASLPNLSPSLGSHFSTNGDLLSFALRAARELDPDVGPVITATLRGPDELDVGGKPGQRGFYLQDAGYPSFVNWLIESANTGSVLWRVARFAWRRLVAWLTNAPVSQIGAEISRLIGNQGMLSTRSMPMLIMGRDAPAGKMYLRSNAMGKSCLEIDWPSKPSAAYFRQAAAACAGVANALGAKFFENPVTHFFGDTVTVHPLGGCSMGATREQGVVDSFGEVYGHPGLYVADGSVMPGPVGPNPSLTIAALAERFATRLATLP